MRLLYGLSRRRRELYNIRFPFHTELKLLKLFLTNFISILLQFCPNFWVYFSDGASPPYSGKNLDSAAMTESK